MSSSSRGRNFRRRGDNDDEENEDKSASATAAAKLSSSKPKKKPSSLLSFADDDNEEESTKPSSTKSREKPSRLAKPLSAHKVTTTKDRHSHPPVVSNVQPQAGTYTKEALLELQKNTRTLLAPSSRAPSAPPESRLVLKGSLKPKSPDSDSKQRSEDSFRKDRDDAESRLASMDIDKGADSSFYPEFDKAAIEAIRAKREKMRLSGLRTAAPDYISLDAGTNHEAAAEESSDEEETGPLFGRGARKGVFDVVEERAIGGVLRKESTKVPVDDEEDEEEKMWEEEQFRKGLGKRLDDGSGRITSSDNSVMVHVMQQQRPAETSLYPSTASYGLVPGATSVPPVGGPSMLAQGFDVVPISQQAEVARKALEDNLKRLKESHGRTVSSLERTDENLSNSLDEIARLENSLSVAGEKFIFMQKLRDFVSVICAFLQHKAPLIEELEEHMQKLNEERASAIIERRNADNDDEMLEVEIAVKAAMSVFSQRGNSADMIKDAASAAQVAYKASKEKVNLPVKLDEFGRDLNQQKRLDMERRAEARKRRKARFDFKRMSSMETDHQKVEGESSTDESDSETPAYHSHRVQLLQTADEIFSDASDEYSQLSAVKNRFEKWKKDYLSVYRDAYMSKVIPEIFSPYVRLELLKWDPLHADADFSDMKWHSLLFDYGFPGDKGDLNDVEDEDSNLVPRLVEKVALPILHHEISHCWDMLSSQETKNAVLATSLVIDYLPVDSEALAELLVAVHTRLADAVSKIMVPTWSLLVLKAVPNAAQLAAYRFGMSVRLLRNICLWKEVLALPVLQRLALDELLYGKILPHLRNIVSDIHDAVRRTERIIASLSGVWTGTSVTKDRSHKLQPLVDYVLLLRKTLERRVASGMAESETGGLARRLIKMLTELNQYDNARDTAKAFHIKEAL